uniref:Glutaredoxin domain-containing protein n=1 Tax=Oryza nivara TaxID=4536 RepID=A0A0E0FH03_ORYNI
MVTLCFMPGWSHMKRSQGQVVSLEVILEQAGKSFDTTYMHLRETRQSDENKRVYVPGKSSNVKSDRVQAQGPYVIFSSYQTARYHYPWLGEELEKGMASLQVHKQKGSHGEVGVDRPHERAREIEPRAASSYFVLVFVSTPDLSDENTVSRVWNVNCSPNLSDENAVSRAVSQPAIQQFRNYSSGLGGDSSAKGDSSSTRVAADPDTHQDFQPTSKSSNMSFDDIVARDIKENPVLIYMKGFPESPMCGFSALAIKVLKLYDVPISARDILGDLKLKECVKAHTNWPTFPQIFIKGEFVGGSDIILDMHQASELIVPRFYYQKGQLKDVLGDISQKHEQKESS